MLTPETIDQLRAPLFLLSGQARVDYLTTSVRPTTTPLVPSSTVHFVVHPAMAELQVYAAQRGWIDRGWTTLSVQWLELHYTVDGWKTARVLNSTDVPCPVVNGLFYLPNVAPGTEVEFALHVGLGCHAPHDTAYARDTGDLWFNQGGQNYRQRSK